MTRISGNGKISPATVASSLENAASHLPFSLNQPKHAEPRRNILPRSRARHVRGTGFGSRTASQLTDGLLVMLSYHGARGSTGASLSPSLQSTPSTSSTAHKQPRATHCSHLGSAATHNPPRVSLLPPGSAATQRGTSWSSTAASSLPSTTGTAPAASALATHRRRRRHHHPNRPRLLTSALLC